MKLFLPRLFWRLANPLFARLALVATTWAVLETTGRQSGRPRRIPIAGALQGRTYRIIAVHGRHASFVRNLEAEPRASLRIGRRWHTVRARLGPVREIDLSGFGWYPRLGPRLVGVDPVLVELNLEAERPRRIRSGPAGA